MEDWEDTMEDCKLAKYESLHKKQARSVPFRNCVKYDKMT